ncbi:hypothetical protein [Streptomyces sp. NBC_01618]|uniref:hypothetical protein n=1 Tax=Streptomyces sp. NBC_01618 TaxID=2975900 RepID=UPI00386AE73D|nr:hypothetical protein OH735_36360 [Streptomyces sp. NBC_01618]
MSTRVGLRSPAVGLPPALLGTVCAAGTATGAKDRHERPERTARVTGSAVLGDVPPAGFSNGLLPRTVDDDRGVLLCGIMTDGAEAFDANGRLVDSGIKTSGTLLKLPRPLGG